MATSNKKILLNIASFTERCKVCLLLFVAFVCVGGFVLDSSTANSHNDPYLRPLILSTENCSDSEKIDCRVADSLFNACANVHNAKLVCRHYCQLCNLTDGNWSEWSKWSHCDVTCGTGHRTRNRTCSNPPPANQGLDCLGNHTENIACFLISCPVHGGWSDWVSWGACSATCGIGMQRRNRLCSNPPPQFFGDHCFGDGFDVRICMPRQCTDGGWSTWSSWSGCSRTCGEYGIRTRDRQCNNPTPSFLYETCQGSGTQSGICWEHVVKRVHQAVPGGSCCLEYTLTDPYYMDNIQFTTIRLCDGGGLGVCVDKQGRVEIFYNSVWGTVCDDVWDQNNNAVNVLCNSIGFCSGINTAGPAGGQTRPTHLDEVRCNGTESNIFQCQHLALGVNDCGHGEDIHVSCE